jgi:hypothetical protein
MSKIVSSDRGNHGGLASHTASPASRKAAKHEEKTLSTKRAVFAPMEGAELDTAIEAILSAEFAPAEFLLEERRTDLRFPGGDRRVLKLVSVKRLTEGIQRQYNTGSGGGWPFEFERDLRLGLFGKRTE